MSTLPSLPDVPPGTMLSKQPSLPKLPMPDLETTLKMLTGSCLPLLGPKEGRGYQEFMRKVAEFKEGKGPELHKRLVGYAAQCEAKGDAHWLESMWLNGGYLMARYPTFLNVNWQMMMVDHPSCYTEGAPRRLKDVCPKTVSQLHRAANLLHNAGLITHKFRTGSIPVEMLGKGPMCMSGFTANVATTRVPGIKMDEIKRSPTSDHVVVAHEGRYHYLRLLGPNGAVTSRTQLLGALMSIKKNATGADKEADIGVMTTAERTLWARTKAQVAALHPRNAASLRMMDSAIIFLILDDTSPETATDLYNIVARGHPCSPGSSRWYDAAMQLVVFQNGRVGVNGEHTPTEAIIGGQVLSHSVYLERRDDLQFEPEALERVGDCTELEFAVDASIQEIIAKQRIEVKRRIGLHSFHLFVFPEFGGSVLEKLGKPSGVHPDSFCQMVGQLTFSRLHPDRDPVTYETASLRNFFHGRTEVLRSYTQAAKTFLTAINGGGGSSKLELLALFKAASKAHMDYLRAASSMKGCDRHLMGLQAMLGENEEVPDLLTDPTFERSKRYVLSTSNVTGITRGPYHVTGGGGFAAMYPEGYGFCYRIMDVEITIGISSKTEGVEDYATPEDSGWTDLGQFVALLPQALRDLKDILEGDASKL